jgi:hypothetical protein
MLMGRVGTGERRGLCMYGLMTRDITKIICHLLQLLPEKIVKTFAFNFFLVPNNASECQMLFALLLPSIILCCLLSNGTIARDFTTYAS